MAGERVEQRQGDVHAEGARVEVHVGNKDEGTASVRRRRDSSAFGWKLAAAFAAASGLGSAGHAAVEHYVSPAPDIATMNATLERVAQDVSEVKKTILERDMTRIARDAELNTKFSSVESKVDTLSSKIDDVRDFFSRRGGGR